jgi:hypothetical protein
MIRWLTLVLFLAVAGLKSRRNLLLEILALRHQLLVLSRKPNPPRLMPLDRCIELSRAWGKWKGRLFLALFEALMEFLPGPTPASDYRLTFSEFFSNRALNGR